VLIEGAGKACNLMHFNSEGLIRSIWIWLLIELIVVLSDKVYLIACFPSIIGDELYYKWNILVLYENEIACSDVCLNYGGVVMHGFGVGEINSCNRKWCAVSGFICCSLKVRFSLHFPRFELNSLINLISRAFSLFSASVTLVKTEYVVA